MDWNIVPSTDAVKPELPEKIECLLVTTPPHKKVKKKLDRFLGAQNRNDATPAYCPVYWHATEPTTDFSGYEGFCVKKPILSSLSRSTKAEKSNDMMRLLQTYSISVNGQPRQIFGTQ